MKSWSSAPQPMNCSSHAPILASNSLWKKETLQIFHQQKMLKEPLTSSGTISQFSRWYSSNVLTKMFPWSSNLYPVIRAVSYFLPLLNGDQENLEPEPNLYQMEQQIVMRICTPILSNFVLWNIPSSSTWTYSILCFLHVSQAVGIGSSQLNKLVVSVLKIPCDGPIDSVEVTRQFLHAITRRYRKLTPVRYIFSRVPRFRLWVFFHSYLARFRACFSLHVSS